MVQSRDHPPASSSSAGDRNEYNGLRQASGRRSHLKVRTRTPQRYRAGRIEIKRHRSLPFKSLFLIAVSHPEREVRFGEYR